jgi:hypothetical protein
MNSIRKGKLLMRSLGLHTLPAVSLALLVAPGPGEAGCGCDKPPPVMAQVRPAFASPGDEVTLFSSELQAGVPYRVRFDDARDITAVPVLRRDFGDGAAKLQLVVKAPSLPPGPTKIKVERESGGPAILKIEESGFTMLQPALALPEADVQTIAKCYRAAVGEDGTVYFPFDVGAIAKHTIFSGIGKSYPLLFGARDIVIYNTQGIVMQLLGPQVAEIYSIEDTGTPDSLELLYDRHEFETYRTDHQHADGYGLDATDPNWHVDGTRHIDHDHLVLAIRGVVEGKGKPKGGTTPAFDLDVMTFVEGSSTNTPTVQQISWGSCRD